MELAADVLQIFLYRDFEWYMKENLSPHNYSHFQPDARPPRRRGRRRGKRAGNEDSIEVSIHT